MGHADVHESYLSLQLKSHNLKREGNISLENANAMHSLCINSARDYDTYFSLGKIKMEP